MVGRQLCLVAFELRPSDIGRQPVLEQHRALLGRRHPAPGRRAPRLLAARVHRATAIGIRAGINRVVQQVAQRRPIGPVPVQVTLAQAQPHPVGKLNPVADQMLQYAVDGPAAFELLENQRDRRLRLLVGIADHLARRPPDIAHRHRHAQFAARRLGPLARHHPLLEHVQFRLRQGPLQPQQQPIVVVGRIVNPVQIADQGAKQPANLQQLVPVATGAGQPRHLHPQHETDMIQSDFRDQALEPRPAGGAGRRFALIVIDHQHPSLGPAQPQRPVHQAVLQPGRFLVPDQLLQRRLPHVHHRQPVAMMPSHLLAGHRPSPHRLAHPSLPPAAGSTPNTGRPVGPSGRSGGVDGRETDSPTPPIRFASSWIVRLASQFANPSRAARSTVGATSEPVNRIAAFSMVYRDPVRLPENAGLQLRGHPPQGRRSPVQDDGSVGSGLCLDPPCRRTAP